MASAIRAASSSAGRIRDRSARGNSEVRELEAEVDGLLQRLAILGQMRECGQGLVETGHRFSVRGARRRLLAGLAHVAQRLVPELGTEGMMGELLDVFSEAVGEACLDGLDDLGMQRAPAIVRAGSRTPPRGSARA